MAERMSAAHRAVVPASVTLHARVGAWHGRQRPLLRLVRALLHACAAEPATPIAGSMPGARRCCATTT